MCLLLGSPPASSPQAGRPDGQGMQEDRYFHQTIRTPAFDPSTRVHYLLLEVPIPLFALLFVPKRIEIDPVMVLNCASSRISVKPP